MSGTTTMYALKPIITLPNLKSKNVLYEMKNIHEVHRLNGNHSPLEDSIVSQVKDQVTIFLKEPNPDVTLLEKRQEKILSQLADLKQQIATLFGVLKSTNRSKSSDEVVSKKPVNVDLILTANPKKAPFSIFALAKLWSDSSFQIQTHVHSTITGTVPEFTIPDDKNNTQKNIINLRLIWKDVSDLELKSEFSTYPISGEVNFLRYLSRLVETHNYENTDPVETNLIDSILDLCHMLSNQSPREAQATISNLGDHLTNGPWFLNKKDPSLVDIAAWSLIKRLNSKLPSSLAKWFQNCEKTFL